MWSRVSRTVLSTASAAVLVAALAGCGDDDPKGDGPTPSGSSAPTSAGTTGATEGTPSATVAPATGPLLEIPALSLHLTEGPRWRTSSLGTQTVSGSYLTDEGYPVMVTASDISTIQTDLEADAKAFLAASQNRPAPRRIANRVVDGVEAWAAEGSNADKRSYWVGGLHGGRQWSVQIETPIDLPGADELREQILASITWKV
ncbi:hypothetical protein ACFJIY_04865 [Pimelobacter simplex]|uniref:hypothetical protein n=1 Tax=Nocardioides simplex TaxID=2045 RepID=UPI0036706939